MEDQAQAKPEDVKKAQKAFGIIFGGLVLVILLITILFIPNDKKITFFVAAVASLYALVQVAILLMVYGAIALFVTIFSFWIMGAQGNDLTKSSWKILFIFFLWPLWLIYLFIKYSPVILPAVVKVLKGEDRK